MNMEEAGIIHFANNIRHRPDRAVSSWATGFAHIIAGSIAEDLANHPPIHELTLCHKAQKMTLQRLFVTVTLRVNPPPNASHESQREIWSRSQNKVDSINGSPRLV